MANKINSMIDKYVLKYKIISNIAEIMWILVLKNIKLIFYY